MSWDWRRTLRLGWLFNRRVAAALGWAGLVMLIAVAANGIGISVVGGVSRWEQWIHAHVGHFFVWRLCVYGVTAWGWHRMRQRLHAREGSTVRLVRSEVAAVLAVVVLEASVMLR